MLSGLLQAGFVPLDHPPLSQQGVPAWELAPRGCSGRQDLRPDVDDRVFDQQGALRASLAREDAGPNSRTRICHWTLKSVSHKSWQFRCANSRAFGSGPSQLLERARFGRAAGLTARCLGSEEPRGWVRSRGGAPKSSKNGSVPGGNWCHLLKWSCQERSTRSNAQARCRAWASPMHVVADLGVPEELIHLRLYGGARGP